MRRRDFIKVVAGSAVTWPHAAHAQQSERLRRVGVLVSTNMDADQQANVSAFVQALQQLGWTNGRNVRIDIRWTGGEPAEIRRHAEDLVAQASDVVVASGNSAMPALMRATSTLPIVFVQVADPVGAGYVDSMAAPGSNATGFVQFDYTLSGKWLELLREIAPQVRRAAVLRDPAVAAGVGQFAVIEAVAPSLGMDVSAISVHDTGEIERGVAKFASRPNGGLVVTASALSLVHHDLIIALASRHKLPAVYYRGYYVSSGGLISYGYDAVQQFRGAAGYVDRILKDEKPADLPVQAPNKYELALNLKTAGSLGLSVPQSILSRADEVIE